MVNVVTDLLVGAMNNAVNAPVCAVQDFIGAMTTKIISGIDSIVGPVLEPIQKFLKQHLRLETFLLVLLILSERLVTSLSVERNLPVLLM